MTAGLAMRSEVVAIYVILCIAAKRSAQRRRAGRDRRTGSLDQRGLLRHIAGRSRKDPMSTVERPLSQRINWTNVLTVLSAAVLIGAEVFGAAFAGGWALARLLGLSDYGVYVLQTIFFVVGMLVMAGFVRAARRIEPFTSR
jgi:hypothetical protein